MAVDTRKGRGEGRREHLLRPGCVQPPVCGCVYTVYTLRVHLRVQPPCVRPCVHPSVHLCVCLPHGWFIGCFRALSPSARHKFGAVGRGGDAAAAWRLRRRRLSRLSGQALMARTGRARMHDPQEDTFSPSVPLPADAALKYSPASLPCSLVRASPPNPDSCS